MEAEMRAQRCAAYLWKKSRSNDTSGRLPECVFAIVAVRLIFKEKSADILPLLSIYAAAGCVLGHNFPVTLGFRGGKGIAASVGFLIAFDWRLFVLCAIVFLYYFGYTLCFFMFSELLSGGTDRNDRAWRDGRLWHGQKSYDRNVHSNGIPDGAGFLETQGKYCPPCKWNRKQSFPWKTKKG